MTRLDDALGYLTGEFGIAHKDEFRKAHGDGGDMLLDAILSGGYAKTRGDEIVLTDMGHRRHAANRAGELEP